MRRLLMVPLLVCLYPFSGLPQRPPVIPRTEQPLSAQPSSELLKHQHEQTKKLSARLAQLAAEVEQELDKSGENVLPVGTLKKLKKIEKLARKIRGRIKR